MIEGAKKMPEPMTLPTIKSVASRSPRPRTSPAGRGSAAPLVSSIARLPPTVSGRARGGYHVGRML